MLDWILKIVGGILILFALVWGSVIVRLMIKYVRLSLQVDSRFPFSLATYLLLAGYLIIQSSYVMLKTTKGNPFYMLGLKATVTGIQVEEVIKAEDTISENTK